jgi:hypothetical protein
MIVDLLAFNSKAFCVSSAQEDMIDLNDCVGCRSKVLDASSVELPIAECNMTV